MAAYLLVNSGAGLVAADYTPGCMGLWRLISQNVDPIIAIDHLKSRKMNFRNWMIQSIKDTWSS
jgi:hypothetical protein